MPGTWKQLSMAFVFVIALLAGCWAYGGGGRSGTDGTGPPGRPDPPAAREPEEPEVTLKFYFGGEKKAATDEVWAEVGEYVKAKGLNVKFSVHFIPWPEYSGKLLAMAASGDKWDLNFDSENSFRQMAARGSYLPLNELLPKYAPNLYAKYEALGTLASTTVDGEVLGLPWTIKMNQRFYAGWRVDLAEQAGIRRVPNSVRTIEDVDLLLRELKRAYPNAKLTRIPPLPIYWTRDEWVDLGFHGLGFYLNDPVPVVRAIEQQPFYLEAARLSKVWYDDKLLNRDVLLDNEDTAVQWRNGSMLFTLTSHEWAYAADPGFSDPSYRQQMSLLYPDKKSVNRSPIANLVAINRNSEHPDRVLRFLDMLETDRTLYDLVIYGIEGKTYVMDGETVAFPDGMRSWTSNYMEWGGQWAFWKPQYMRPTRIYPKGFWEAEEKFANLPVNVDSPVEGFFIARDGILTELALRNQAYEEIGRKIEFGVVADADQAVADYIRVQKENGLDRIIAEVQRQLDRFLAERRAGAGEADRR